MSRIKLITDSACDLPKDIIEKLNINIIPLNVSFGEETFVSGKDIDNKTFYQKMEKYDDLPKTSCPSPDKFIESFKCEEDSVLVLCLSSKLSGTYNSAVLAKNILEKEGYDKRIEIIDTMSGSVGQGHLVYEAAKLVADQKSIDDVVEIIEKFKENAAFFGTLETLENAIKGGRINPLAGKIINTLNLKAIIHITDGVVKPIDKARGEGNSLKKVIKLVGDKITKEETKTLFIGHANCEEKGLKVKQIMESQYRFKDIILCEIGSVMGTYTAKGAILISSL
ncbi:DegV family protein [Asaccharospora irregularis]|uniref:EDD domain protein, DegV family n=1 Tax=Asaccharospora irregularis DSM 2635 TaxID=1121321 RepID=A0A1M5MF28_9FIRM|nr:DegV family protein [Asaccharospora irregularis]SHG75968.1 EDD domain protein, DegV family [Asaccharospora irregularis DSM 2635]